ncbi:hypothetical protein [Emticicia sp. SJ17W-69]|uniref:hypothetical protein n=1 Tax=Emticicia sp. SJ17W-69 TaxID=3421657 RepID=UPI003EBDCE99
MKINIGFIIIVFLVLIGEIGLHELNHQDSLWTNNCRIISLILMGTWYYINQKGNFNRIQKAFLISILLPIIVSLSSYLIPEKEAIIINIFINMGILMLWIYAFKHLGASITLKDNNQTLQKLIPAFFVLPLLYYYFSLYQALPRIYAIIVLVYILIFSYTAVLSAFLPLKEDKKFWLIFGVILLVIVNILNGFHTFLQNLVWAYPVSRTLTVASKCMMIYGMICYGESKPLSSVGSD